MTVIEKDLVDDVFSYEVVLVPMSINNSFKNGFRRELEVNFKGIKTAESKTPYGDQRKYGTIYPVEMSGITFCFCYMYRVQYRSAKDNDFVDYESLKSCLRKAKEAYREKRIASPIMGSSVFDGNGNRERIINIYKEVFGDEITLYDHEYESRDNLYPKLFKEAREKWNKGEITLEDYRKTVNESVWKFKNGRFKPMPDGYNHTKDKNKETYVNSKD